MTPGQLFYVDAILERAGRRCERCQRPDGQLVYEALHIPAVWYDAGMGRWRDGHGTPVFPRAHFGSFCHRPPVHVALEVAFLDHNWRNLDPGNLAALCERCYAIHERGRHAARTWATRRARARQLSLWPAAQNGRR